MEHGPFAYFQLDAETNDCHRALKIGGWFQHVSGLHKSNIEVTVYGDMHINTLIHISIHLYDTYFIM